MEGLKQKIDFSDIERKQWIFAGVLVGLAFVSWFFVYLAFYQVYAGFQVWGFAAFFIFLLATGVGLSFFLFHPCRLAISTYIAIGLISFLFFGWRGYDIIGVGAFLATIIFGYLWMKREEQLLIKFLYTRLIRRGMPIFFTGLAIALAVFYNASPMGKVLERPQLPEAFFSAILVPVEYISKQAFPGFDRNMKLGDIEELSIREVPKLIDAPPVLIETFVRNTFSEIPKKEQDKTLVEFLHETVNNQLDAILLPYRQFLPIVFLFGLFLVFKAIGIPLMWLSIGMGWLIVKILVQLKLLQIRKVEVEKEELVM